MLQSTPAFLVVPIRDRGCGGDLQGCTLTETTHLIISNNPVLKCDAEDLLPGFDDGSLICPPLSLRCLSAKKAANLIREDDEVVYGDSAYLGTQKRSEVTDDVHLSTIDYRINRRPASLSQVSDKAIDWERHIEFFKSSARCKRIIA